MECVSQDDKIVVEMNFITFTNCPFKCRRNVGPMAKSSDKEEGLFNTTFELSRPQGSRIEG